MSPGLSIAPPGTERYGKGKPGGRILIFDENSPAVRPAPRLELTPEREMLYFIDEQLFIYKNDKTDDPDRPDRKKRAQPVFVRIAVARERTRRDAPVDF
jgi:hypothetical protein